MTWLTEALQIALITEEPFDVGIEIYEAHIRINDRNAVVYLHLSGGKVFLALIALIVLCQSPSLHIDFLLCLCLFQRFIASGVFAGQAT